MNTPEAINPGGIGATRNKPSYRPDLIICYHEFNSGVFCLNPYSVSVMGIDTAFKRCIDDLDAYALAHDRTRSASEWAYRHFPDLRGRMHRGELQAVELEWRTTAPRVVRHGFFSLSEAPKNYRGQCAYLTYSGGIGIGLEISEYRPSTSDLHSRLLSEARGEYAL